MSRYLLSFRNRETLVQFVRLGIVGGFNTLLFFVILNVLRWAAGWPSFWAVTGAFAAATAASYVLNRRWTFGISVGWGSVREGGSFYLVNTAAWAATAGIVVLGEVLFGPLGPLGLNAASVVATGFILLPKFAAYRDVVFRGALDRQRAA